MGRVRSQPVLNVGQQGRWLRVAADFGAGLRKWRLTLFFAFTALVAIGVAAIAVNHAFVAQAEDKLKRLAEKNTAQDALHVRSMLVNPYETHKGQSTKPLTLEFLLSPNGLPSHYPVMKEGFNIVLFNLYDPNGSTVWSNDPAAIGTSKWESPGFQKALNGSVTSQMAESYEIVQPDGMSREAHIAEAQVAVRETASSPIIGVMELHRDVSADIALQVEDVRRVVLWITIGTMGGLFLILIGFIVAANVIINRSRLKEMATAEETKRTLEARVRQRTQEPEHSNRRLVEAQDQLVRSERLSAIGQLAGGVAHDLRNPLGAIRNAVYYVKRRLGAGEPSQANPRIGQFLQIIEDEVHHSNQIITDLMGITRLNPLSLSACNLAEVIESTVSTVEPRPDVLVVQRSDPALPAVLADGDQLRRVFANLIINAQDAMPNGGTLTITTRKLDEFAEVAFKDTGVGISEENIERVFDSLFTTKAKGTGLGLSICLSIVERHHGTLRVASSKGEGATFTIRLPCNGGAPQSQKEDRNDG